MTSSLLTCISENPTIAAASGGSTVAFSKALQKSGIGHISFGFSSGTHFSRDFDIWDGNNFITVTIEGNYFDHIDFSLDEIRKRL